MCVLKVLGHHPSLVHLCAKVSHAEGWTGKEDIQTQKIEDVLVGPPSHFLGLEIIGTSAEGTRSTRLHLRPASL